VRGCKSNKNPVGNSDILKTATSVMIFKLYDVFLPTYKKKILENNVGPSGKFW
jgi:hypothetical protein